MKNNLQFKWFVALILGLGCGACEVAGLAGGTTYEGSFSGPMNYSVSSGVTCTSTYSVTGRVEIELDESSGSNVNGEGTIFVTASPGPASPTGCGPAPNRRWDGGEDFSGPASDIRFDHEYTDTGAMTVVTRSSFTGALSNGEISGTVTIGWTGTGVITPPNVTTESATATFNVVLRK
jgi:hypothetical protein